MEEKEIDKIEKEREREIVYENKSKKLVPFFYLFFILSLSSLHSLEANEARKVFLRKCRRS